MSCLTTLLFVSLLFCGLTYAQASIPLRATCTVSNGLVYLNNVPPGVQCVGRSDIQSKATPFMNSNPFVFGALTTASSLTITLFSDVGCSVLFPIEAHIACNYLPDTTCHQSRNGILSVFNINSVVKCVTRGDLLSELGTNIVHGNLVFPTRTQFGCGEVQLNFYSDINCSPSAHVKTDNDVFCLCGPPPSTQPPTTPPPTCIVANGLVEVSNVPSSVGCIGRSDISSKFINPPSSFIFGALTQASYLTLTLYSDENCAMVSGTTHCRFLPPTTCVINSDFTVTVSNVEPPVQCVRRGDTGDVALAPFINHAITFTTPTEICPEGLIQINLFSDKACTKFVKTIQEIDCLCPNYG